MTTTANKHVLTMANQASNIEELKFNLKEALKNGHKHIVLDLKTVSFLDSQGLGQIMGLYKIAMQQGALLSLYAPTPYVTNLIKLTKLDKLLLVLPSL
jgi:anti-anti-sigma factor